jgi:hypothetical protein
MVTQTARYRRNDAPGSADSSDAGAPDDTIAAQGLGSADQDKGVP